MVCQPGRLFKHSRTTSSSIRGVDLQCRRLDWSFGLEPEHYQNSLPVPIRWYYSLSMLSHALILLFHIFLSDVTHALTIFYHYDLASFTVILVFHAQFVSISSSFYQIIRKTLPIPPSFIYTFDLHDDTYFC